MTRRPSSATPRPLWAEPGSRAILVAVILLAGLSVLALLLPPPSGFLAEDSYAQLHLLMEIGAILTAFLVFGVNFHQLEPQQPGRMLILACALLASAALDLGHALSFKGMPTLVTPSSAEKGIAFWLPGRLMVAGSLLIAALMPYRPLRTRPLRLVVLAAYLLVAALVYYLVLFHPERLPETFIEGRGLTRFKVNTEILITTLFALAAAAFLWRARRGQEGQNMLLFAAAAISAAGEMLFTQYKIVNDTYNLMGHSYKLLAYVAIYHAEFVLSVRAPFLALHAEREKLAQANIQFRQIFDLTAVGMTQVDPATGRIVQANRRFATFLGYAPHELIGKHFAEITYGEDRGRNLDLYQQLLAGDIAELTMEKRYVRKDGKVVWGYVNSTMLRDLDGQPILGLTAVADITALREAESERLQLQQQLQQSQKMEALGQLTGGIAHDFNNILATIMGYADLALERFVPDRTSKLAHYLGEIGRASERARDLVSKLLAYSRTQRRTAVVPLLLEPAVRQTVAMLQSTMPAGITVVIDAAPDLPPAAIDVVDLQQILMNLIINARDAIGEHGRIGIEIGRYREPVIEGLPAGAPAAPERLLLRVCDSGPGIPEQLLPRIFDPFFTTKEVGKGTGLGLSVVQGIVRNVGGQITAENRSGGGACLTVVLPAALPAARPVEAAEVAATTAPPADTAPLCSRNAVVWVVEDQPSLANFMQELLACDGCTVRLFADAEEALEAFRARPSGVDLVLTDQTMPRLSGAELAKAMLAIRPSLPIILATGYSDSIDADIARRIGIRRFLKKPMTAQALLSAVDEALTPPGAAPASTPLPG